MEESNKIETDKKLLKLKKEFDSLCDEQEALYRPEFDDVFEALYEIDKSQEEIYRTTLWNTDCILPDKANQEIIQKALEKTGFSGDEDFCKAFSKYANVTIAGKRKMQEGFILNLANSEKEIEECKQTTETDGWQFYPITIIAPPEVMPFVEDIIQREGGQETGLFANNTDIPNEDEEEDELLMIDAFGLKGSLVSYWDDLKRHKVIGDNGLLKGDFRKVLLESLNQEASFVKANTDKPAKTKNHISQKLKAFDEIPVWGIFFQILILRGLCCWLEGIQINEGDNGYKEAQSLSDWLSKLLLEKIIAFCSMPFGTEDKKKLKPLCDYLYTTTLGQAVQEYIRNMSLPQQRCLPDDLNASTGREQNAEILSKDNKPKRERGRPKKQFKEIMINDPDGTKLSRIHSVIDGKRGKDVALIILACIMKGWTQKPTYSQVRDEFGDIGAHQGFNKYLTEKCFTDAEIKGAKASLD